MRRASTLVAGTLSHRTSLLQRATVLSSSRWCSTTSTDESAAPPPPKRLPRRRAAPVDDDVVDFDTEELLRDADGGSAQPLQRQLGTIEPLVMRPMAARKGRREEDDDDEFDDHDHHADGHHVSVRAPSAPSTEETIAADASLYPQSTTNVVAADSSDTPEGMTPPTATTGGEDPLKEYFEFHSDVLVAQKQDNRYLSMPISELVELVKLYLRATENIRNVSAREEAFLFPALMQRLDECTILMQLEIVEHQWARSTLVRHGTLLKDVVRDRIAVKAADLTPEEVLRCIIVMGMSAGRRKRDLEFFQVLGRLFMIHVNAFKDPSELVRVLTAFSRAKIVPPPSFLALMGRRLQVLCKNQPLPSLPAYRAFVNLHKMGYDNMNAYRFLADRIAEYQEENVKLEKTRLRVNELMQKQKQQATANLASEGTPKQAAAVEINDMNETQPPAAAAARAGDLLDDASSVLSARRRFSTITGGLKPNHVTKLLLVLARFGAPHQQYLRPVAKSLIIPHMMDIPPPSFTRLLRSMRLFKTTDVPLLTAAVDRLIQLGPDNALLPDLLEALRILSLADVPVVPNLESFIALCAQAFGQHARLRAGDMCAVANDLMQIQRKDEIPLEAVEQLCALMDTFAERMTFLIHLGVLALPHAEALEEMCKQMHHPDTKGKLKELSETRRQINQSEGGDDEYYMAIDIDVRETFHKAQIFNNWNTYGSFRPLPGVLQVDFQHALTEVSAECILEAAHLFELAYPGRMILPLQRLMSKAFLAKLSEEGEWVISPDDPLTMTARKNEEILFTRESLKKFSNFVVSTPLVSVKKNAVVWALIHKKAQRLQAMDVAAVAETQLRALVSAEAVIG
ncbi:Hypothetical protein, putative [Bodo saltans]|uniref:Mitochondrial RNA binding complex 1 subunit n=1 Tax=Bodo saltans TaxID=75058 RepID=A0A0S4KHI2_BODSA|nr:Hypothetical protein, putative [Bodo saltans]|eukprot:CUI11272.1 Hypothetical protein, putative [Bodo saltans]